MSRGVYAEPSLKEGGGMKAEEDGGRGEKDIFEEVLEVEVGFNCDVAEDMKNSPEILVKHCENLRRRRSMKRRRRKLGRKASIYPILETMTHLLPVRYRCVELVVL